jgi:arylsulfatase A-like enzyme
LLALFAVAQTPAPPNIVLIVADDLGYGELRCYNPNSVTPTPNIDALAANGVRFTNAHVTTPVCGPSRAGLLTGKYPSRFGFEMNGSEQNFPGLYGLPLDQRIIPQLLKTKGYRTAIVGKWHMGWLDGQQPQQRGFDYAYGIAGGGSGYFEDSKLRQEHPIFLNGQQVVEKEYLTDAFRRRAVTFVRTWANQKPFFLYLPFNAIHAPLEAPQKYLDRFPEITERRRKTLSAMLSAQDDAVGEVMAELKRQGVERNTLVLFVSDNGGEPELPADNRPLRGAKFGLFEGGVRVPMIMSWAGRNWSRGQVYDRLTSSVDIMPTILARAGIKPPFGLDGRDLTPFVTGLMAGSPHTSLFFRFGPEWAVVTERYKRLHEVDHDTLLPRDWLFDLDEDIGETDNRILQVPKETIHLEQQYAAWQSGLPAPTWFKWP